MPPHIRLRLVEPADLLILCEHQLDPEAARLAAVVPREPEDFHKHWAAVLSDSDNFTRAILADEVVVGQITCFPSEGQYQVGYWIGREFWGRGIATQALQLLLEVVSIRPLHATAARGNPASIRVLERNGFVVTGYRDSPATDRYLACEEAILRLE
jgi:RimJ/RimL family protein N-acetyltransferase